MTWVGLALAALMMSLCGAVAAAGTGARSEVMSQVIDAEEETGLRMMQEAMGMEQEARMRAGMGLRRGAARTGGLRADEQKALAELRELAGCTTDRAPRVILVPAGEMDDERTAALLDDLIIMSRVLDKTLAQAFGKEHVAQPEPAVPATPMFASAFAPQDRQPRALYLDGYGAVFMLSVRFPLIGPPPAGTEGPEEEPASLWEQTQRELTAPPEPRVVYAVPQEPPFRPESVEKLKNALLTALEEAKNMRSIGAEEALSVIVFGTQPSYPWFGVDPGVLTLHARKADVDALAAGTLPAEEFVKKVTIIVR